MTAITINGNAYSDDGSQSRDMRGGGHESWLLPMLADTMTEVANASTSASDAATSAGEAEQSATDASNYAAALRATSTSSLSIGTGSKTFATQTGKQFAAGGWIIAVSQANANNWMTGTVTSYGAGSLVIDVVATGGSGTVNDWAIFVSGARGAQGPSGAGLPSFSGSDALKMLALNAAGDATAWQTMPLRNIQIFTSGGTNFVPDPNNPSNKYLVILLAGGGSGQKTGTSSFGIGGQSGGHVMGIMEITSAQLVTIGAGGAAVSVAGDGNAGSDSSIGSLAVARGGAGGNTTPTTTAPVVPTGCIGSLGQSPTDDVSTQAPGGASLLGNSTAFRTVGADQPVGGYGAGGAGGASGTSGAGGDGVAIFIW